MLPRSDHDQEPKKSYVGWVDSSSTTKDEGKNNMATQRLTEKSMMGGKAGEESRLVLKQESLSSNVERGTKPKPVVMDKPTGYDPFLLSKKESTGVLVGGDINPDDALSKEKKKGGGRAPYTDPASKNVVDSVARTSSPHEDEKEKKAAEMIMRTLGNATVLSNQQIKGDGKTQYADPPPKTSTAATAGVQHSKPLSVPLTRTPSRRENTTFESNLSQTDPSFEKDKKEADSRTTKAKISSSKPDQSQCESAIHDNRVLQKGPSKRNDNKDNIYNVEMAGQYSDSPKKTSDEVPFVPQSQTVNIPSASQNGKKENGGSPYSNSSKPNAAEVDRLYEAEKNIAVPHVTQVRERTTGSYENKDKKGKLPNGTTGQYSASPKKVTEEDRFVPQSQAVNIPSTTQNEKKENGGTQCSNSSKPNAAVAQAGDNYEAPKNIAVPFSNTEKASTTPGLNGKTEKKKGGFCSWCSIL